ncbi:putative bifunctional diguanylate cyclase/phosphodiesterase [Scleromatobacter humisilvae]|uniref:EAL domain-containing protein n=1 Tax=Scleromatobacter humisilvae TaxID=2897159 RepID=A0A9X2C2U5_9BURK|nr:EAL domain-containing protein [Scleromatobacter humisilvae]MCK9686465.1 EAL domain-containing protein [Scleromatobacter humisilvae]
MLLVLAAWTMAASRPTSDSAWILDSLHWTGAFVAAAWVAWRAARAADGQLRRVRSRFALGMACLAAGQLSWDLLSWAGWNPFPGIPNLLYLLLSPCFALGFAATVGDRMPGSQWKSAALDIAGFGLAVLAFTLALFLPHAVRRSALEFVVLTAYPVLLLSAAAAGIVVQLHLRLRPTAATFAVLAGLAGYGALWTAWSLAFLDATLRPGTGMTLMFSLLALLLGWGVANWRPVPSLSPRYDRLCEALLRQIPLAMVAVTSAAAGFIALGDRLPMQARPPLRVLFVLALLCAVVRQTQQLRDRDRLLAAERAVAEGRAQLHHLAHHDPLTGLPNRTLLRDRVTQALATAARRGEKVALMFIDLDRFKEVNDTLGHATGDALLCHVAAQFTLMLREEDTVCRQGGDEFAIVLTDVDSAAAVARAVERVMALSNRRATIAGHELPLSMSVGIAMFPKDGEDFDGLMQCADTAMYRAKAAGRNAFRFYDPQMNVEASERSRLRWLLAHAIERGELHLHFQPYFHLRSGELAGAEVLLRWTSAELGPVGPNQFIPVAEDGGQIVEIGAWVLREACAQVATWQRQGLALPAVAVNLSILQFRHGDLVQQVADALRDSGLPARQLELEITESVLMHETDKVFATADNLKALGVRLAIDDFGTGYSSLAYLKRLNVDKLKIDQSFVRDALASPSTTAIVRAIVDMARAMELEVVAEGIETAAERDFLAATHCAMGQGYLFARPMPADQFEAFLAVRAAGPALAPEQAAADRSGVFPLAS